MQLTFIISVALLGFLYSWSYIEGKNIPKKKQFLIISFSILLGAVLGYIIFIATK